jgi:hypothetical protein
MVMMMAMTIVIAIMVMVLTEVLPKIASCKMLCEKTKATGTRHKSIVLTDSIHQQIVLINFRQNYDKMVVARYDAIDTSPVAEKATTTTTAMAAAKAAES